MGGTRIGGKKSASRRGRKSLAEAGRRGGQAKVKKGFAVTGDARAKGSAGGKARVRKYQDPNFDKDEYRKRRASIPKLRGQGDKPRTTIGIITSDEHLRRANPDELKRQRGVDI